MNENETELVARAIQQAAHPTLKWDDFDEATHALWFREAAAAIAALDQARSRKSPAPLQDMPLNAQPLSAIPVPAERGQVAATTLPRIGPDGRT